MVPGSSIEIQSKWSEKRGAFGISCMMARRTASCTRSAAWRTERRVLAVLLWPAVNATLFRIADRRPSVAKKQTAGHALSRTWLYSSNSAAQLHSDWSLTSPREAVLVFL
jgi:hypothetical protein